MAEGGLHVEVGSSLRYRSERFIEDFFKTLHQLRVDDVYCDVELQIGEKKFSCHRIVLMAGSPYFHAMFISGMAEHDKSSINIGGVSPDIFTLLLEFLYSGRVEVTEENCEDLLTAADMLSMAEVVTACCTFLKDMLQPENCLGIYTFAAKISNDKLKKEAENYINKNFLKIVKEEEYYNMEKEFLTQFLGSENLHVENEYQVFKAAIDWIQHNPTERRKHIFDVMSNIRFPIISEKQMDKYIENLQESDISLKVALQKIVTDYRSDKRALTLLDKRKKSIHNKPHLLVPRKCARKNIYICGGFTRAKGGRWSDARTLCSVERYDTFYQTWHECPSLQYPRSTLGAGVVNGQVCVVGGENDMLILDSMEMYDPITYEWINMPGMLSPRCGLGVCSMNNQLYAVGGWVGSEIGRTIERFDPEAQSWEVVGYCRQLKCWMGVTADKGLIYLVGGFNDLSEELSSVESFNPVTKEWTTLPDLNIRRSYPGVAILDDCLYAVGGWNEADGALKSVEKFNFDAGYWVEVAPLATARAAPSVVVVNNMLYCLGGRIYTNELTAPATLDCMESYDSVMDQWNEAGTMLSSRCEAAAVVI